MLQHAFFVCGSRLEGLMPRGLSQDDGCRILGTRVVFDSVMSVYLLLRRER